MDRRPTGMPHKADKLDSAVNVLCRPGIREALSRVPAIRGDARTCRWDSLTEKLNTPGKKKKNTHLQHTERRKRKAPHEPKEPKVTRQVRNALVAVVHPPEPTPSGGKSLLERATTIT